ncbi:hypothetical protein, partial [Streptomyces sp. NPDC097619]|uniref:hypothetical protein n=1 Tax=Streptomyces sp. NPDC097619 TaxID=3157228 RepID=UPI003321D35E
MAIKAVPAAGTVVDGVDAAPALLAAQSWKLTKGQPSAEEVAALAVVLSAVLSARTAEAVREAEQEYEARCRWTPSAAQRRAATSWAAPAAPSSSRTCPCSWPTTNTFRTSATSATAPTACTPT